MSAGAVASGVGLGRSPNPPLVLGEGEDGSSIGRVSVVVFDSAVWPLFKIKYQATAANIATNINTATTIIRDFIFPAFDSPCDGGVPCGCGTPAGFASGAGAPPNGDGGGVKGVGSGCCCSAGKVVFGGASGLS